MKIPRRSFTALLPAAAGAMFAQSSETVAPPRLGSDLVKDWIVKAHQRQLDPMRALLKAEPALMNASWDWGAGDFESALQAAAHTGSREMALFLLDQSARVDLFAVTMLGELAMLKTAIDTFSGSLQVRGAHGIPLLSHAVVGAAPARTTLDYLVAQGVDVNARANNGITPLMMAVQTGQRETVRLLLNKGADANAKAQSGQTALSLSLKGGQAEITSALKEAGATE